MNTNMQWLLPNRVFYWKLTGEIETEEFCAGLDRLNTILKDATNKIHVVVNARNARSLQGDANVIRQITRKMAQHNCMGSFLVISHSFLFKHQLNMVTADFGTHLRYSDSFRNAWYSLHNIDTTLPYVAPEQPIFSKIQKYA